VRKWTIKNAILDIPNKKSSHSIPTSQGGGGIAIAQHDLWYWFFSS
jgi:hypothetical protein